MRLLALGLILLVALSGCHQAPPTWSLSANGHTEMEGNEVRFIGDVELGGNHDRTTVSGVNVEFRTANHTLLRTVRLGTFGDGGQDTAGLNETFHEPPEFVLVKVRTSTPRRDTDGVLVASDVLRTDFTIPPIPIMIRSLGHRGRTNG